MTRVWIVEDNTDYREALQLAVDLSPGTECFGAFSSCEAAFEALENSSDLPDVLLLDLALPGVSGTDAVPVFLERHPPLRIIILTQFSRKEQVFHALEAGASGYLLKTATPTQVLDAILEAESGGAPLDGKVARLLLDRIAANPDAHSQRPDLGRREGEILKLLCDGLAKKEIASELSISYHTVDNHVRNIYRKLGVNNLSSAVGVALREKML